jgi:hypothetical protein
LAQPELTFAEPRPAARESKLQRNGLNTLFGALAAHYSHWNRGRSWLFVRSRILAGDFNVEATIIGEFDTRRSAELAVEHIVQECGVPRGDVFVQPAGGKNTVGTRPAGADAKAEPEPGAHQKLEGSLEVSVDFHGEDSRGILEALESAGAKNVRTE